jgi:hypothetical protein
MCLLIRCAGWLTPFVAVGAYHYGIFRKTLQFEQPYDNGSTRPRSTRDVTEMDVVNTVVDNSDT